MNPKKQSSSKKKAYRKPEIHRVKLTPEESLVSGCKNVSTSNPAGSTCLDFTCSANGS